MKATESKLNSFLAATKTRFVIPIYQRNYDWEDHHCSQLYADIIAAAKDTNRSSHFIGSIVYLHDGLYTEAEVKELVIIDGQQRLTTISLLYAVLYHYAKERGDEATAVEIHETYLINRFARDRKEKLWQTEENDRIFRRILRGLSEEDEPFSRIRENYSYFKELIRDQATFDLIKRGLGKLSFVEISLERDQDDPQRIFESLNSTGLALSQADLIRNYVLMGHPREEQQRLFDRYWSEIERNARLDENSRNVVSEFVRDFLTFKNKAIPRKSLVYETFKAKYPERDRSTIEELLTELSRYAEYYGKLVNPHRESDREISKELQYIALLEINVSFPFLLQVYDDYAEKRIDKALFIEVLRLTQHFVWRRFLVNLPTNALNKIFMRLYDDIRQDQYLVSLQKALLRKKGTQRMPTDDEVRTALRDRDFYNIRPKNRTYLLDRLENFRNRETVAVDHLTIEHIFPQKPAAQWRDQLSEEDYQRFQEVHLHQLGNLTLSGNNGSLSNRSFQEKKFLNINGGEQGYHFSRLWLNRDLNNLEEWTLSAFKKRHQKMIMRALEAWPYPVVAMQEDQDTREELTIFEIDDPTGYQVEYALLKDQRIEPRSVKEFYVSVLSWLFQENPHPMMQPEVSRTIILSRNDQNARENDYIGGRYSVDTSNSSWIKFKRLETVLNAYNYDDEVKVKLKEA